MAIIKDTKPPINEWVLVEVKDWNESCFSIAQWDGRRWTEDSIQGDAINDHVIGWEMIPHPSE